MSLLKKYAAKTSTPTETASAPAAAEKVTVTESKPRAFGRRTAPTPPPAEEREVESSVVEDPKPTPAPAAKAKATNQVTAYNPMAMLDGSGSEVVDSILDYVITKSEEKGGGGDFDGPFPLVKLAKGNSGGSWQFADNVDGDSAAVMPVAKKGTTAMFLGVRIFALAWPEGYKDKEKGAKEEAKDKPLWQIKVSSGDKTNFEAAIKAGEVYQYTRGDEKAEKFDGLGHFRPGVEFLLLRSGVVFVMRLPDHYTSTVRALAALGTTMKGLGGMKVAPITLEPYTTEEPGKTSWKCHSLRIGFAASAEGKAQAEEFQSIREDLMGDPEFQKLYAEWNTTDATPDALAALHDIADMGK